MSPMISPLVDSTHGGHDNCEYLETIRGGPFHEGNITTLVVIVICARYL
jgi:hypothetical protein